MADSTRIGEKRGINSRSEIEGTNSRPGTKSSIELRNIVQESQERESQKEGQENKSDSEPPDALRGGGPTAKVLAETWKEVRANLKHEKDSQEQVKANDHASSSSDRRYDSGTIVITEEIKALGFDGRYSSTDLEQSKNPTSPTSPQKTSRFEVVSQTSLEDDTSSSSKVEQSETLASPTSPRKRGRFFEVDTSVSSDIKHSETPISPTSPRFEVVSEDVGSVEEVSQLLREQQEKKQKQDEQKQKEIELSQEKLKKKMVTYKKERKNSQDVMKNLEEAKPEEFTGKSGIKYQIIRPSSESQKIVEELQVEDQGDKSASELTTNPRSKGKLGEVLEELYQKSRLEKTDTQSEKLEGQQTRQPEAISGSDGKEGAILLGSQQYEVDEQVKNTIGDLQRLRSEFDKNYNQASIEAEKREREMHQTMKSKGKIEGEYEKGLVQKIVHDELLKQELQSVSPKWKEGVKRWDSHQEEILAGNLEHRLLELDLQEEQKKLKDSQNEYEEAFRNFHSKMYKQDQDKDRLNEFIEKTKEGEYVKKRYKEEFDSERNMIIRKELPDRIFKVERTKIDPSVQLIKEEQKQVDQNLDLNSSSSVVENMQEERKYYSEPLNIENYQEQINNLSNQGNIDENSNFKQNDSIKAQEIVEENISTEIMEKSNSKSGRRISINTLFKRRNSHDVRRHGRSNSLGNLPFLNREGRGTSENIRGSESSTRGRTKNRISLRHIFETKNRSSSMPPGEIGSEEQSTNEQVQEPKDNRRRSSIISRSISNLLFKKK